ncbi:MAG: tetratricopeptide repeat protein, partial [Candidatus Obscuribacterales bacterium]|nr:tetratricopeptide repeat protein [Candidatus Obscuribacterales bacterium]
MSTLNIDSLKTKAKEEFETGLWKEAEGSYCLAMKTIDDNNAEITIESIKVMIDFSRLLYLKERKQECKELCIKIADLLGRNFADDIELKIEALLNLLDALSFFEGREYSDQIIKEATELARNRAKPGDRLLASVLCSSAAVALSHDDNDRFEEAEALIDEAAAILEVEQIEDGEELANVLSARAICEQLKGNVETAEACYQKALISVENSPLSPIFSEACFGYATLRATDSKFSESIIFLEQQIRKKELAIGDDHPILKRAVSALALTYSACGELDEAEVQAQRYNRIVEMMGDPGPELRIDCLRILVDILQQQSRFSEAQALLTRAYDIADTIKDEGLNVRLLMDLARLKLDLGLFPEAVSMYERALAITTRLKGPDHFETAMCLGLLGNAYFAVREYEKAEKTIKKSIKLCGKQEEFFGSLLSADNYRYLGLVCLQQKKFDQAEDALLKALSVLSSTGMESTLHAAETQKNLGELYDARGDSETAKFHFERALD